MPRRIAASTLNASTIDILNVIRQNASYDYQQNVPEVTTATDIPKVGEIIYGTPAFANQFINALVNRIALVRVKSANFNNPYSILKKGYIEYGETIEDIFVSIAKVVDFDPEKAKAREFQRTFPDVKSAFHTMNWRVMYPVTIQDEDLRQAFLSIDGVQNLIAKIVDSVYTAAEYDEFLLFKYMLIKAIAHGKMYPTAVGTATAYTDAAVEFRATSNLMPFMSSDYNEAGVLTNTPRDRQIIFMDAKYNAQFDVNVLASAFNMDKADFIGRLFLIDNWTKFDNNNKFTEKYVASGLYWNYFYHTWKTVSNSPFANAICFVTSDATITLPATITVNIVAKDESAEATVMTLTPEFADASLEPQNVKFIQTQALTTAGIGVQPYGALIIPTSKVGTNISLVCEINGVQYTTTTNITGASDVGDTVELTKKA